MEAQITTLKQLEQQEAATLRRSREQLEQQQVRAGQIIMLETPLIPKRSAALHPCALKLGFGSCGAAVVAYTCGPCAKEGVSFAANDGHGSL